MPIPVPARIAYVITRPIGKASLRKAVEINPPPARAAEISSVKRTPIFFADKLPKNAPRQKKVIVSVKLVARKSAAQLNSSTKGILRIDQV